MPNCEELQKDFAEINKLKNELVLELENGKKERNFDKAEKLIEELKARKENLQEKMDPNEIALRDRLAKENEYTFVSKFVEGLAVAKKSDDKYYFIDKTGKTIKNEGYSYAEKFSDGLARVAKPDGKYYYIDKHGRRIFS